jgi:hypothetical protein
MAVTADKPAPYAPVKTILDIVDRYRNRGLVFPITGDVLARAGVPESLVSRTLQALVTLDLFNDAGNPTETLEGIRLAPEAEYKKCLQGWLKSAYFDVFQFVDPTADDETRIRDAFRSYHPQGQQSRMVSLFQGLCAAAELVPENGKSAASSASATSPRRHRAVLNPSAARSLQASVGKAHSRSATGLPPAVSGLLQSLPSEGNGWSKEKRQKFLNAFGTVLDLCFPVVEENATTENGGQP